MFFMSRFKELERRIEALEYDRDNLRDICNKLVDKTDYLNSDIVKVAKANQEIKKSISLNNPGE